MNRNIEKYLKHYSEPECALLNDFPLELFQHCTVIPAFDEEIGFITEIENVFQGVDKTLFIIVVNQPDNIDVVTRNRDLLNHFISHYLPLWTAHNISLYKKKDSRLSWLIVNRCEADRKIPNKQGVGLARKIGCDLAIALFFRGCLSSTWIHCTDADTQLPENYFDLPEPDRGKPVYSAAVFNFRHVIERQSKTIRVEAQEAILKATRRYELALNYYVAGLRWAGSPYAHHTIGSTLAYSVEAYCQVRGFPKRAAGEDFYLLNKLCKIAPIYQAKDITVLIDARCSDRVPFGTGPAVNKILQFNNPENEYKYYSPQTFIALKQWLDFIPDVWASLQENKQPMEGLDNTIQDALAQAQIHKLFDHLKVQTKNQAACTKAIHDWFDGFQTLKFIRRLQESTYQEQALNECIAAAPFTLTA